MQSVSIFFKFFPSVPPFVFVVLFIPPFHVLSRYLLKSIPLAFTKCSHRVMKKILIKFHKGALTIIIFRSVLQAFHFISSLAQNFQLSIHFHPCHPLHGTDDLKQGQRLNIVLNNKTERLFF